MAQHQRYNKVGKLSKSITVESFFKDGKTPDLMSTTDYKLFKYLSSINRDISDKNIKLISNSKSVNDFSIDTPIIIDNVFNILEGQHRLIEAEKNKRLVYFKVAQKLSVDDIPKINSARTSWRLIDYINYYAGFNNEHYITLRQLSLDNNLSIQQNVKLLLPHINYNYRLTDKEKLDISIMKRKKINAGHGLSMDDIRIVKDGKFSLTEEDVKKSKLIYGKLLEFINVCPSIIKTKLLKSSIFLSAFITTANNLELDWEEFLHKADLYKDKLTIHSGYVNYIDMFADVYNFNVKRNDKRIFFKY